MDRLLGAESRSHTALSENSLPPLFWIGAAASAWRAKQKQQVTFALSLSFRWNSIRHFSSSLLGWLGTNQSAHTMHFSPPRRFFYTVTQLQCHLARSPHNPNAASENNARRSHVGHSGERSQKAYYCAGPFNSRSDTPH